MANEAVDAEAKKMIYEAYDLVARALEIKEDHYAVHKWMAVLLDKKSSHEGKKARIRELYNVKNHMLVITNKYILLYFLYFIYFHLKMFQRATELNPKDATSIYMVGNWCYHVSDLAWYQRKIAALIFGEPPNSSFEEALQFFEKAERVEPNFYNRNHLMLEKTYLKLNRKEEAVKYLKQAAEFPAKNDDDLEAKQEAAKLVESV